MVDPIDWQSQLVDPATGRPTQLFLSLWQQLRTMGIGSLADVNISNPADGDVLTYSAAQGKWINL